MATKVYLSGSAAAITPAAWLGWANTTSAITKAGLVTKANTAQASVFLATSTTGGNRAFMRFVLGPLASQTISGNVSGVLLAVESTDTANCTLEIGIQSIYANGASHSTLLGLTAPAASFGIPPEFDNNDTGQPSTRILRTANNGTGGIVLTSNTVSDGEYLAIELGVLKAVVSSQNATLYYGDPTAGDYAASDGNTSTGLAAWVQFTQTLSFYTPSSYVFPALMVAV